MKALTEIHIAFLPYESQVRRCLDWDYTTAAAHNHLPQIDGSGLEEFQSTVCKTCREAFLSLVALFGLGVQVRCCVRFVYRTSSHRENLNILEDECSKLMHYVIPQSINQDHILY